MNKNLNILLVAIHSVFIIVFGLILYCLNNKAPLFLNLIVIIFIMFIIMFILLNKFKNILIKIKKMFPNIWGLLLFLEIIYILALIFVLIFYKEKTNTGIYHSNIIAFFLLGCIVSCQYTWIYLKYNISPKSK